MKIKSRGAWIHEDEETLRVLYEQEGITDPYQLGLILNKNHRAVISKLVQLKIYKKSEESENKVRTTKTLMFDLERLLNIEIEGDNVHSKRNLLKIVRSIERLIDELDGNKENTLDDY